MFQVRLLAGLLFAGSTSIALAQPLAEEEDLALAYGDKNFVSIATGARQQIKNAPSVATVITAEDIASMGATTVDEALESVPGLHVSRSTLSYAANYGMRGILTESNPHVLMMVNGIPMTSVYQGSRNDMPVALPVENIARIEVIRGPSSALYGADAFAGTINIITKTADEIDGTIVGARAGSFNRWDTWFQHGSRVGDLEIAGYLKIGATDGQRRTIREDAQTAIDNLGFAAPASLAPGSVNQGHDDIDAQLDLGYGRLRWRTAYTQRHDIGVGVGVAGALDPTGRGSSERFTSDVSWNDANFARDFSLTLQAAFMHLANEITTPAILYPRGAFFDSFPNGMIGDPDKWERQQRFSAASVYSGLAGHRIRFGVGHDRMEIYKTRESKNFTLLIPGPTPTPLEMYRATGENLFLAPHKRRLNYLYVQDEWNFARDWTLTGGIRHDKYSDFGGTTNPRLALVWEARHDLTAKLMYGSAYRAPSFVEQYATGNPIAMGNPSLTPEKIKTLEAALSWQIRHNLQGSLSLFQHRITDIINQVGNTYRNGGKQKGHGGELEISWAAADNLQLAGHYAYQRNTDESTGEDAGYAPHHHFYARADWRFLPGWHLSTQVNHVADRRRAAGDTRPDLPDYTSTDLTLRSERSKSGWDFSASVYNLFNADIREPSRTGSGITYDLPLPGRTFWLQARFSL
ncbi:MAG: TonB-dependent receptor [Dechloromonas sp.]|nr:MAG: TonB-dependent receptor [Dechloromonas sp.]